MCPDAKKETGCRRGNGPVREELLKETTFKPDPQANRTFCYDGMF